MVDGGHDGGNGVPERGGVLVEPRRVGDVDAGLLEQPMEVTELSCEPAGGVSADLVAPLTVAGLDAVETGMEVRAA